MFIDEATILLQAGKGGSGCMSFRREKYRPLGGPDGGDGGKGGDIVLKATSRLNTLMKFRRKKNHKAEDGVSGQSNDKHGKAGPVLTISLPVGTVVKRPETDDIIVDLSTDNMEYIIALGGQGGRGNARFKTSTNRAPRQFDRGKGGEECSLKLELKLLADVGIVGYPNAGKSTLISKISSARPKIANYPFTTLVPNLGVVSTYDFSTFVVADIPGIIKGAHKGKGLGINFLRHVERTTILLHVIDFISCTGDEIIQNFNDFNKELSSYSHTLSKKKQIIVANKLDVPEAQEQYEKYKQHFLDLNYKLFPVSAATGFGIKELIDIVWQELQLVKE